MPRNFGRVAIKQPGANCGGYFDVNSAHPLENPTPLSDFQQVLLILLIPASMCYMFGELIGDHRQGWAVLASMSVVFVPLVFEVVTADQAGNPEFTKIGVDQKASAAHSGGNIGGKEGHEPMTP